VSVQGDVVSRLRERLEALVEEWEGKGKQNVAVYWWRMAGQLADVLAQPDERGECKGRRALRHECCDAVEDCCEKDMNGECIELTGAYCRAEDAEAEIAELEAENKRLRALLAEAWVVADHASGERAERLSAAIGALDLGSE